MTAPHFRMRLVEARLCHLLAQLPLFQIQFPSPLPLFRSKLWTKRVHLIYTAAPPTTTSHYSGHSPKWRLCVCVCVQVHVDTPENDIEPAFLIPVLRLIGGQLSIVVAVVPDFLLGCLLLCFSAVSGSPSHTPCTYHTATTAHAILMTYLSLHRKWNAFCLVLYVTSIRLLSPNQNTHNTHRRKKSN